MAHNYIRSTVRRDAQAASDSNMEAIDHFYGYFNLVLGTVMALIGFKIYRPFKKDKEEEMYRKWGNLYKVGGIAMIAWGLIKVTLIY
jgi:hypothetical protein